MTTPTDAYLTPREVAAHLRVSSRTVLNLIAANKLRARRFGVQWRIKPLWLEEYERTADQGRAVPTALTPLPKLLHTRPRKHIGAEVG